MVASSKIFNEPLNLVPCKFVSHRYPHQNCTEALIWALYRNHISSGKYYLPLLLLPLILKWRKLNRQHVLATFKYYLQTLTFASTVNALSFYLMCICRRLIGRYVIWSPFMCTYLAAQLAWLAPSKVLLFFATGITQSALEGLLRQLNVGLVHSRAAQTLIFMLSSLIVLEQQRAQRFSGFWFIRPAALPQDYGKWPLMQRLKKSLIELRTYLGIGLTLDLLNAFMRKDFKQLRLKSTSFMCSYMALYRLLQAVLTDKLDGQQANMLAAFLSGSAFGLFHRLPLTFMTVAVVIAGQVLWQRFCAQDVSKRRVLAALQQIPWAKLLMPINLAYLVSSYFFQEHVISGLARSFLNASGDKNVQRVNEFLSLPSEAILSKINSFEVKKIF